MERVSWVFRRYFVESQAYSTSHEPISTVTRLVLSLRADTRKTARQPGAPDTARHAADAYPDALSAPNQQLQGSL